MDQASASALLSRIHGTITGPKYRLKRKRQVLNHRNRRLFFGLPPELRKMIYWFAAQRDDDVFLRNFKPPGMCRASAQMRQEFLPIFFEVNTVVVEVPAPVVLRQEPHGLIFLTARARFFGTTDSRFSHTGLRLLDSGRTELLLTPELKLLFQNIDLIPLNFEYSAGLATTAHHVHGSLVGSAARSSEPRLEADLRHITTGAGSFVRAHARRNEFRGLSPSGFLALARKIRVDPRTGPDALLDDLQ